jgi:hypothetical protein
MQAHLAATLRHLKEALTHLHDARLIIGGFDKLVAANLEILVRATREEIRKLEQTNQQG